LGQEQGQNKEQAGLHGIGMPDFHARRKPEVQQV
jgi:hypothetical protein